MKAHVVYLNGMSMILGVTLDQDKADGEVARLRTQGIDAVRLEYTIDVFVRAQLTLGSGR